MLILLCALYFRFYFVEWFCGLDFLFRRRFLSVFSAFGNLFQYLVCCSPTELLFLFKLCVVV
jgi:hypothetical protein